MLMFWGYNLAMNLGAILGMPLILPLALLSSKRRKTLIRRLGITTIPEKSAGMPRPVWVHALSVGEVMAAVPLVRGLKERFPGRTILFSVTTLTGFELARRRIDGIQPPVFFFPFDWWPSVEAVVRRVAPAAVLVLETDLWPNFIYALQRKKVPLLLVNARISQRSFTRYQRFATVSRRLFSMISAVCAPTAADSRRFALLGVEQNRIQITGNLKHERGSPEAAPPEIGALKRALGFDPGQRLLVAGSTHKGEEESVLRAFLMIRKAFSEAGVILAPRDPRRAGAVCRLAESFGIPARLLSETKTPDATRKACLVVDRLGVMDRLYAAADVVFIGGSLVREGGHNPLEPGVWGKPVLFGPDMSDFASIAQTLLDVGAAVRIHDATSLAEKAIRILKDPQSAEAMGRSGLHVTEQGRGALEKILDVVEGFLQEGKPFPVGCTAGRERLSQSKDNRPGSRA